jgi:hypothetical protein
VRTCQAKFSAKFVDRRISLGQRGGSPTVVNLSFLCRIKHLQEDKIIYHTYQMKQDRAYRIVIRNLHYSTPIAQITAELEKQGHKVRNILNVKHRITKGPLSLFFIDLEPKENTKAKNTSFDAQDFKLMVIQKHTVQNHMPALNVEETTTQPHVRKHQIHQQNMRRLSSCKLQRM